MVKVSDFSGDNCAGYMRLNLFLERNIYCAKRCAWFYSYCIDNPGSGEFMGKNTQGYLEISRASFH